MVAEVSSPLERQFDLVFPVTQIETEVETRLKRLAKTVRLHGFRPGKAPLKLIAVQYGSQVRQEVMADSIQRAFSDRVKEQKLRVAGLPRFEPKEDRGDASKFEFVAKFEVYPEVVPGDLSAITIKHPQTEVAEADVDRTIEILRKQRTVFEPVERGAQAGDGVEIDYLGRLEGKPFDGGAATGHRVILGDGKLIKQFEDSLLGMKAGETKRFPLTFPTDYHASHLAGREVEFEVTLKSVQAPRLPALDAEFAKALGVADGDMDKMRAEVRANLEREVKSRTEARVKAQVMQALLDSTPVALPQTLVNMELARMGEAAQAELRARGAPATEQKLPAELVQSMKTQAERRVGLGLVVSEIVKREGLAAKPEQVRAKIEEHAQTYENPQELVNWYYQQQERVREVDAVVVEDNVVRWVLSKTKTEVVPTPFTELMGLPA